MHLLCWFHLLQHRCVCACPDAATCCSTTGSTLLLPLAAAPLYLLRCSHLLQHKCICSVASVYYSTIVSDICCFHLLQHHCVFYCLHSLPWIYSTAFIYCSTTASCFAASTCCSTTPSSLLPRVAAPLPLLCCLHLLQHYCISAASTYIAATHHVLCYFCCSTIASALLLSPHSPVA